jgi:hypothetical protein
VSEIAWTTHMVAQHKKKGALTWLTFSAYTLKLIQGEVLQANGLLFDGSRYALEFGILKVNEDSVTLRCTGRIAHQDVPGQYYQVSLVPGIVVALEFVTFCSDSRSVPPSLCLYWEPSVQVCPGQTAVLVIGQQWDTT